MMLKKLIKSLQELVNIGHYSNYRTSYGHYKTADWIIDLGLEGGDKGGNLLYQGTPENFNQ